MALSITLLQVITLVLGYLVAYGIYKSRIGYVWGTFAYVVAAVVAWPVGVIAWAVTFSTGSPTDAIVNGMSRSFLFALIGPAVGLYIARRQRERSDVSQVTPSK